MPRIRTPKPPTPAEQKRARWAWIKTLRPQPRQYTTAQWAARRPVPVKTVTARDRQVMRDSTRAKRARRDREAMTR